MSTSEFEAAAKNAVANLLAEHGCLVHSDDLDVNYLCNVLGRIRCMIYSPEMDEYRAEVVWSGDAMAMTVTLFNFVDTRYLTFDKI